MAGNIRKALGPVRRRLENHLNVGRLWLEGNKVDGSIEDAKDIFGKLVKYLEKFNTLVKDLDLASQDNPTSSEQYQADVEDYMELSLNCDELGVELANLIDYKEKENVIPTKFDHSKTAPAKLPKISLPNFSGDRTKWSEFWETFQSIINNNKSLNPIDKFNYLKGLLSGEAAKCIGGMTLSESNYEQAIILLEKRYGNRKLILENIYEKFRNLDKSNNSAHRLRYTINEIENYCRSLLGLGEDITHSSFISLIKSKFPPEIILQLEEFELHTPTADNIDECQQLRDRLDKIITIKEQMSKNYEKTESKSYNSRMEGSKSNPSTTSALVIQPKCHFCSLQHWSDNCTQYATVDARKDRIQGACYLCLQKTHKAKDCKSDKVCYYCKQKRKHHRSLCYKNTKKEKEIVTVVSPEKCGINKIDFPDENIHNKVCMQTATVTLVNSENKFTTNTRVLLDSGSQRTYITEQVAKNLGLLPIRDEYLSVSLFNSVTPKNIKSYVVKLLVKLVDGTHYLIYANVVPSIVENSKFNEIDKIKSQYKYLNFAENPNLVKNNPKIGLLIGNDYYFDLFNLEKLEISEGFFLINSKLGWILSGRSCENTRDIQCLCLYAIDNIKKPDFSFNSEPYVLNQNLDLQQFWTLEILGIREDIEETSDDLALKQFENSVRFENGRYSVSWPWRYYPPENLANNYGLAMGRLKSLYKRISVNTELLIKYNDIIKQQLNLGMIEIVNPTDVSGSVIHYLPHHTVITPQKTTTKVRIVFDGSATTKKDNLSLNQCLLRGRILIEDLVGILLRARFGEILVTADIEKAFLQISLNDDSKDVTRFIWMKDPTLGISPDNLVIYRFRRILFGIISSPFILNAVLKYHLNKYDNHFSEQISKNIYVDNVVVSLKKSDACEFYQISKNIFKHASMNLREWNTNDKAFLSQIPTDDRDSRETITILGLVWDTVNDKFKVKVKELDNSIYTKRSVLTSISSIFDPIGFVSPIILMAKIFLQQLWKQGKDWDEDIGSDNQVIWLSIKQNLLKIKDIEIPRMIFHNNEIAAQLHCFCDASQDAYAAVVYIRRVDTEDSMLLYSKIRITPIKMITIPRLELLSVLIGTRILKFIQKEIGFYQSFIWTDSQCLIKWLRAKKPLPLFVERRILEIKSIKCCDIRFVPGELNVSADLASRGCTYNKLIETPEWWSGPTWLRKEDDWPRPELVWANDEEVVEQVVLLGSENNNFEVPPFDIDINKYSKLYKLLRVTAWCNRAIQIWKGNKSTQELDRTEIEIAREMWIKFVQNNKYREIFKNNTLKKGHQLVRQLGLYIDINGIIRCKGRYEYADLELGEKCPILLPTKDKFTELIISDLHQRLYHVGTAHTLAQLRTMYWVPQGRAVVHKIIKKCILCRKIDGRALPYPDPPPLPEFRVTKTVSFEAVGIDYLGPLYTKYKGQNKTYKVWVCLFTCLATRAIHMEVVEDMTGEAFLLCFRRFIARRGVPQLCISDNAWQFKNTTIVLDTAWAKVTNSNILKQEISKVGITWKFIPEFSPWMGGVYERLVASVKKCLKKSLRKLCLSHNQLCTVICEIEAILNSRPLVYVGEGGGETITPAHFLSLRATSVAFAPSVLEEQKLSTAQDSILKLWKKGENLLQNFWKIWRGEYLLNLRERSTLAQQEQNFKVPYVDQIVHIKEEKIARQNWKLGKIIKLNLSTDGAVRSAVIQTNNRSIVRPVSLLYPLEIG